MEGNFKNVPTVLHKFFSSYRDWNKMGSTQIDRNPKGAGNMLFSNPFMPDVRTSLMQDAKFHVKNDSTSVLMFHGTSFQALEDFKSKGILPIGFGNLEDGFYATFNFQEALGYACNALQNCSLNRLNRLEKKHNTMPLAAVLEIIVTNANQLHSPEDYLRDDGMPNQYSFSAQGIKNMKLSQVFLIQTNVLGRFSISEEAIYSGNILIRGCNPFAEYET
jgi:hypothetical protein